MSTNPPSAYCINPKCSNPVNYLNTTNTFCLSCNSNLLLQNRYRPLRYLGRGGFCQTYIVDDRGTEKVLKVLDISRFTDSQVKQTVEALFKREAKALSRLNHPGIPKVNLNEQFSFWHQHSQEPLLCLVMEKIEGVNLEQWLRDRDNQPITATQALNWLKQLVEILHQIHQHNFLHRDIKPANIMLKPDGQLVLIDFGAVKEFTQTYLKEQEPHTEIGTIGYAPQEQLQGNSKPVSDFFALGRTFIHLLTGTHPINLRRDDETDRLIWRDRASYISNTGINYTCTKIRRSLADLIDELIEPSWRKRPANTQIILNRLKKIEQPINLKLTLRLWAVCLLITYTSVKVIYPYLYDLYIENFANDDCSSQLGDRLSCGEEVLVPDSGIPFKNQGVEAFKKGNYDEAIAFLEKARLEHLSDPETLIYLNNARLGKKEVYTIAVVAPISKSLDTSLEILRGVAQAQTEINQNSKIKGKGLKVLIADDGNSPYQAKEIAGKIVNRSKVLAVVGHYASEVTLAAIDIYQKNNLVLISPGSTSEELSHWGNIPNHSFFRTVPNTRVAAQSLSSYLINQAFQQKAALFYSRQSSFSLSLREQFKLSFSASGGEVVEEFDMSNPLMNASAVLEKVKQKGATVIGIFPDGGTTAHAFPNSLRLIKANRSRYWIAGGSTLYNSDTLQLAGKDALNKFVTVVSWHHLDSNLNPKFIQVAKNLWKGDVSWRTATAYDATQALITAFALEKQTLPSRIDIQKTLASENFQSQGATGKISFRGGDRHEPITTLVKVVESKCSKESYMFMPINYSFSNQTYVNCPIQNKSKK